MSRLKIAAMICHALAILPMLVGGVIYTISDQYFPHHAAATSYQWDELTPGLQILFQAMLNGAGSLMLLTALTLILLLVIPFRQDEQWCFWAIPLIGISAMILTIRSAVFVDLNTPSNPPWLWLLIIIVLFLSGLFLSYKR